MYIGQDGFKLTQLTYKKHVKYMVTHYYRNSVLKDVYSGNGLKYTQTHEYE